MALLKLILSDGAAQEEWDAKSQLAASEQQNELQQYKQTQEKLLSDTKQQLEDQAKAAAHADRKLHRAHQELQQQQQQTQQLTNDLSSAQAAKNDTLKQLKEKEQAQHKLQRELHTSQQQTVRLKQQLEQNQHKQLKRQRWSEVSCHAQQRCMSTQPAL